jgi:hypothetical protein
MDGRSGAFVVHRTPHRIRIKIPQWQRQDDNFAVLRRALESRPGVLCVRVNPLAASIVINCSDGFEIASVRDCFAGLELFLGPSSLPARARQIADAQPVHRGSHSASFVGFVVGLAIAIATRQFVAVFRELILEAVMQVLLRQLRRRLMGPTQSAAPPALLVAATE